jgi:hypothetical protein
MKQENGQLDIPDRPLLVSSAQPSVWTEIGEAQVTHTIFGRAKVRIIRKNDNVRRVLWMALAFFVIAVAAWQGWLALQQTEPLQSAVSSTPISESVQERVPASQPEYNSPSVTPPTVISKPSMQAQTEINKPAISQKSTPQLPQGLKGNENKAAKPVAAQPLIEGKPRTAPLATNNNASKNPTDKPLLPKLSPTSRPIAPVVATSRAKLLAEQPAASSPVAMPSLSAPLIKEDTSTQSPASDKQPAEPANTQSK